MAQPSDPQVPQAARSSALKPLILFERQSNKPILHTHKDSRCWEMNLLIYTWLVMLKNSDHSNLYVLDAEKDFSVTDR